MLEGQAMGKVLRGGRKDNFYNFRIRAPRIEAGYTLKRLSRETGISTVTLNKYEKFLFVPKMEHLYAIGKVLDVGYTEEDRREMEYLSTEIRKERTGKKSAFDNPLGNMDALGEWEMDYSPKTVNLDERGWGEVADSLLTESDYTIEGAREANGEMETERHRFLRDMNYLLRSEIGLSYRDASIVMSRFGNQGRLTLDEIAQTLVLTGEGVRQIEERALEKIRVYLLTEHGKGIEDYVVVGWDRLDLLKGFEEGLRRLVG